MIIIRAIYIQSNTMISYTAQFYLGSAMDAQAYYKRLKFKISCSHAAENSFPVANCKE